MLLYLTLYNQVGGGRGSSLSHDLLIMGHQNPECHLWPQLSPSQSTSSYKIPPIKNHSYTALSIQEVTTDLFWPINTNHLIWYIHLNPLFYVSRSIWCHINFYTIHGLMIVLTVTDILITPRGHWCHISVRKITLYYMLQTLTPSLKYLHVYLYFSGIFPFNWPLSSLTLFC